MTHSTHFVGLDISQARTSICICNSHAEVVFETTADTDPEAIANKLAQRGLPIARVGLEAGQLSAWIHDGLTQAGLSAVCIDPRQARMFNRMQINKNDRNDARGIARMMAMGVFKPVHVKSLEARGRTALLVARRTAQSKLIGTGNAIRGELKVFGLRTGPLSRSKFEARVREMIADDPMLQRSIGPLRQRPTVGYSSRDQTGQIPHFHPSIRKVTLSRLLKKDAFRP